MGNEIIDGYTMEFDSVIKKKNESIRFIRKEIDLEIIILSEVAKYSLAKSF